MTARRPLRRLIVVPAVGDRQSGLIRAGAAGFIPCALGRAGIRSAKREGDGATPRGRFRLLAVLYRPDRLARPASRLPVGIIDRRSGWCDDPADRAYNRPVRLPYLASHERLWRDDRLYDVVVILDYNMHPAARRNAGSAIFLHLASEDFAPTAGCLAVSPTAMRHFLARVGTRTVIDVR